MPATEKYTYSQKLLHVTFAVSSLALFGTTIWMFGADHTREWKGVQRKMVRIETTLDQLRLESEQARAAGVIESLEKDLLLAQSAVIDHALVERFVREMARGAAEAGEPFDADSVNRPYERFSAAAQSLSEDSTESELKAVAKQRASFLATLNGMVAEARFHEEEYLQKRKFKSAEYDSVLANLGLLVRDMHPGDPEAAQKLADAQDLVDEKKRAVDEYLDLYQVASQHRQNLESLVAEMKAPETAASKALADGEAEVKRLEKVIYDRTSTFFVRLDNMPYVGIGKRWLELPIIDGFNGPRKIDNLWTKGLTMPFGSFGEVRRFDRCTTCHQSIDKSMAGSADKPAYEAKHALAFILQTPDSKPEIEEGERLTLEQVYGFRLAAEGLIRSEDVLIADVQRESLAAQAAAGSAAADDEIGGDSEEDVSLLPAEQIRSQLLQGAPSAPKKQPGLQLGDRILQINGDDVRTVATAQRMLLDSVTWGKPIRISVQRGLPHPFVSHPRLDLFVGSLSPHKKEVMGCTVCHEGQGNATAFQWASHSPNTPEQGKEWKREHGWFENHHWIFPMAPKRFAESSCLKCHHEVVDLEPSEKFTEPPAPKLVRGHLLIKKYGCYGCHEINGHNGVERNGPDLRLEPNVFAAAQQLKSFESFGQLSPEVQGWVEELISHPDRTGVQQQAYAALTEDAASAEPVLGAAAQNLIPLLKQGDTPGELRKAGPALRFAAKKLDKAFLFDWITNPLQFRPSTRMPRFFGMHKHIQNDASSMHRANDFEPLEAAALATYLLERSQQFDYIAPPEGAAPADVARGQVAFETRGCLACHTHDAFPEVAKYRDPAAIVQGPDLSRIGSKFDPERNPAGPRWLYSWIREPARYHVRTKMPNLFLDAEKNAEGVLIDPAADIVAYLLTSRSDNWSAAYPAGLVFDAEGNLPEGELKDALKSFSLEKLEKAFFKRKARQYYEEGIPADVGATMKGSDVELIGQGISDKQRMLFIGHKTIGKYGCYACHDIPGFEDAKPIGTALADWGRKDTSKIAFEHIGQYLASQGHAAHGESESGHSEAGHSAVVGASDELPAFYEESLLSGSRTGFIYQKLRDPRGYDYDKTHNKTYDEWLRMPQFPFDNDEREAVITFVLGLVAEPPADQFVYHPSPREKAIMEGRKILAKFNCGSCHLLETEKWDIAFQEGDLLPQPVAETFPFVNHQFSADEVAASLEVDDAGLLHGHISGMPSIGDAEAKPLVYDDEGDQIEEGDDYDPRTLEYAFDLWRPAVLGGETYQSGVLPLTIRWEMIRRKQRAQGGVLARALLGRATELEKQVNPNAKGSEAWAWLPPPLVGEGAKVQSKWLYDFLIDPYPIRPAVLLRMPKFNLSSDDAEKLVNYFAAKDNAEYPYSFTSRRREEQRSAAQQAFLKRVSASGGKVAEGGAEGVSSYDAAMRIVTDNNYCIKCHLVGDFEPKGSDRAKAPNLAAVYERLHADYLRTWLANPKRLLPYTAMPVNVPYKANAPHLGGVSQELYPGSSVEQVEGLVDFLMNYDDYAKRKTIVSGMVKEAPPEKETPAP